MGKSKKEISEIERGVGYLMGLVTGMMDLARTKGVPFEALYRLVTPEGAATLGKIVDLAHESWRESEDLEFTVKVDYRKPVRAELEETFRDPVIVDLVAELFDRAAQGVGEASAERTLVLKRQDAEMSVRQRYFSNLRHADLFEAYALARLVNERIKAPCRVIARGTTVELEGRHCFIEYFKTLSGRCELSGFDTSYVMPPDAYHLYVRENLPGSI